MAKEDPLFKQYLTCIVCTEIFENPVSLSCHHSFCSSCLQDFWAQAKNKNCPVCRRKSSKDVAVNFSMKELAESYAARQRSGPSDEAQARRRRRQDPVETYEAMFTHLKKQRVEAESRIRAEFEQQHRSLREKEEAGVKALREEEELKLLLEIETLKEQIRKRPSSSCSVS
ncbi:unnamed protein product [Arctogadus glacialis]